MSDQQTEFKDIQMRLDSNVKSNFQDSTHPRTSILSNMHTQKSADPVVEPSAIRSKTDNEITSKQLKNKMANINTQQLRDVNNSS